MTLRNVRNVVLVAAIACLVLGVYMTVTDDHAESAEITIGHHVTRSLGGFTFNIDTIISTLVAGAVDGDCEAGRGASKNAKTAPERAMAPAYTPIRKIGASATVSG